MKVWKIYSLKPLTFAVEFQGTVTIVIVPFTPVVSENTVLISLAIRLVGIPGRPWGCEALGCPVYTFNTYVSYTEIVPVK